MPRDERSLLRNQDKATTCKSLRLCRRQVDTDIAAPRNAVCHPPQVTEIRFGHPNLAPRGIRHSAPPPSAQPRPDGTHLINRTNQTRFRCALDNSDAPFGSRLNRTLATSRDRDQSKSSLRQTVPCLLPRRGARRTRRPERRRRSPCLRRSRSRHRSTLPRGSDLAGRAPAPLLTRRAQRPSLEHQADAGASPTQPHSRQLETSSDTPDLTAY
ncbi:hypothetical protein VT03_03680 [Planctomyces sp. SH-PL14]|nr:hypothetical protein VT03_03680 [Planctomyces sp. SH-PL14]